MQSMPSLMKSYLPFAYLLLLSLGFLHSCKDNNVQGPPPPGTFPVVSVATKSITAYSTYPVSIEGTNNSAVRVKVSGYITDVFVDEGQAVKKGQRLFKLETQSLSQDAEAAQANVNAAQVEVNKLMPLVEKGIISNVQLETAKARLVQAQSGYNSIAANIGYANIQSPIDGYVGAIPYREGSLVSPSDQHPLTTVSTIEEIYAFFVLNEKDYLDFLMNTPGNNREEKIQNFPEVELQLATGSIYKEKGKIETVTGQINQATGTVTFRAKFPNPDGFLANGSSGKIRIPRIYKDGIVIPESATYERQGKTYAYKVQGDTIAVSIPIEVTERVDSFILVQSGLEAGDKIVTEGVGRLRNNTPIIPRVVDFDSITSGIKPVFQ